MAETIEHFDFRHPLEKEGWTEGFCPGRRRSSRTGSVSLVAPHEVEAVLDELDEQRWEASFAKSQDLLAKLAAQAERDDQAGLTDELDPDRL